MLAPTWAHSGHFKPTRGQPGIEFALSRANLGQPAANSDRLGQTWRRLGTDLGPSGPTVASKLGVQGGCWRRLSDAIVRRARRAWLIDMSIDMRLSTMRGLGRTRSRWADRADTDIGPHHVEAAAYLEQERIALRWAYNSTVEEI